MKKAIVLFFLCSTINIAYAQSSDFVNTCRNILNGLFLVADGNYPPSIVWNGNEGNTPPVSSGGATSNISVVRTDDSRIVYLNIKGSLDTASQFRDGFRAVFRDAGISPQTTEDFVTAYVFNPYFIGLTIITSDMVKELEGDTLLQLMIMRME